MMTGKSRTYFVTYSHTSYAGSGYGSMTVVTPDGLMTPKRLEETIKLVKRENPDKQIVVLGFFPCDREPEDS
jgi:hypothetical protein